MKILNYGSLNLDYVYTVDHIVKPGETITSSGLEVYPGGKGLNQSVALARAGACVSHAGLVGEDGALLLKTCKDNNIDTSFIRTTDIRSGNAIIQIDADGENCIVLFAGANRQNCTRYVDDTLNCFGSGDLLILQNEVNLLDYMIDKASSKGIEIALNPSPFDDIVKGCDFSKVSYLFVNEIEGGQISGETVPDKILSSIGKLYPQLKVILTLGRDGAYYKDANAVFYQPALAVNAVDTTAAGDTFTGYFLAEITKGSSPKQALLKASSAAALTVSRKGAVSSIPWKNEID